MSTNRFEIESVSPDIGVDDFHMRYFVPERPVVIRGIGPRIQRIEDLSVENIRERIIETGMATVRSSWFQGPAEMLELLADTPPIVARELEDSHRRRDHCRLWINGPGNVTPSHYDGNMIYVFNLQLKGRKEWRIVSPHTPLRNYPFARAALLKSEDGWPAVGRKAAYCDFVLEEGDMVFVPALWHHAVRATAEHNVNINWVATRTSGFVESRALERELELLKFALVFRKLTGRTRFVNRLLGTGARDYLDNYAGVGWAFIEEHAEGVKLRRALSRVLKEAALTGFALRDMKALKRHLGRKPLDSVREAPVAAT